MLLLVALAHAADPVPTFLAGRWEGRGGTETWTRVGDGLVGVGFSGGGFEVLLVEEWERRLAYVAFPGGADPTAFGVESVNGSAARFTAPAHDFPQVIAYRRRGDRLVAKVGTLEAPCSDRIRWRADGSLPALGLEAADRAFAADVAAAGGGEAAATAWVGWFDSAGWSWNAASGRVPAGPAMVADVAPAFADGAQMTWEPVESGLSPDGALGFTVGTWRWTGAEDSAEGGYVSVWKRQVDGSWKVVFDLAT